MLRGLKNTLSRSGTGNGYAAGSGAQGASVINAKAEGNETALAKTENSRTDADATGKEIEVSSSLSWSFEEQWTYVESLGVCKLPGEEHILRFLADSLTASPLPAPWAMHRDEEGKVFYGNTTTGETRWEHPLEDVVRELAGVCRVCVSLSRAMRERSIADLRETWEGHAKEEFAQWYSVKDSSTSKDYYCNSLTGQTMWEHPAEVLLPGHFLKLKSADRLLDEAYLQDLASLGSTLNASTGRSWNLMKRTLESNASASTEAGLNEESAKAIKEELAMRNLELQAARENEKKVKADFDALVARFEEHKKSMSESSSRRKELEAELLQEQQRLASALSECEAWKKQATSKDSAGAEAMQERIALQVELDAQRQRATEALTECEALKKQASDLSTKSSSNESAKIELQAMLEAERRRTQEVLAECTTLSEATKRGTAVESEKKEIEEQLKVEQQRVKEAVAELEVLKIQAVSADSEKQRKAIEEQLDSERKKTQEAHAELESLRSQAKGEAAAAQEKLQAEQQRASQAQSQQQVQCAELQAQIVAERKRVEEVLAECAILKKDKDSALADVEAAIEEEKQRAELKEQLKVEKERATEAVAECERLKQQALENANTAVEEEKQRQALKEQLEAEQRRAEQAFKECEMLKAKAPADLQNAIEEERQRHQLQEQLTAERKRAAEALEQCAALKAQEAERQRQQEKAAAETVAEAARRKVLEEELDAERKRAKEAMSEVHELKAQARFNSLKMAEVESQCKSAEERLNAERGKVEQARAECESLKTQALLQDELFSSTSGVKADTGAGGGAVVSRELREEMKKLQAAASRAEEAERSLHAKLENVQAELYQEKARADQEAKKCVAARDVQEAIIQEMISANQEKRSLRDDLEAKIQEQTRRANDFEARYMQLQAQEDIRSPSQQQADRTFVDRLMKDKESLEKGTQKLQEQLAKANLAANELEAKFNQERLQLEAANIDRQELLQRQKLTAEEAAQADKVLQQQIRSAQEAEVKLSNRAAALKALMEGERVKVEQLTDGFAHEAVGQRSQKHLEDQLQELSSQMVEMRSMLRSQKVPDGAQDVELTRALKEVSAANAQIQTAVAREKDVLDRSGAPVTPKDANAPPQDAMKFKRGKVPRVREFHGKLWASTDDTIQTGQKVRHTMIESALVRQQRQLCKQMIQEVDACRLAQAVKMAQSKANLKSLNLTLREEVEKARQEIKCLEEQVKPA